MGPMRKVDRLGVQQARPRLCQKWTLRCITLDRRLRDQYRAQVSTH